MIRSTISSKHERIVKSFDSKHHESGVLWLVTTSIAIFLLVYQLSSVSNEYFKYETETDVVYSEPTLVSMPGVTICFDTHSIIKKTFLDEKYPNKSIIGSALSHVISVSDIFEITPSNMSIILNCRYKTKDSFQLHSNNREECYKFYQVMKFQKLHKLCYDIRARSFLLYPLIIVKEGLEEPGTFESFTFNIDLFQNVTSFFVAIHSHDVTPRGSNLFPSYVSRIGAEYIVTSSSNRSSVVNTTTTYGEQDFKIEKTVITSRLLLNKFKFAFNIFYNLYQLPPYPPNCFDYVTNKHSKYRSQDSCKDACLQQNLRNMSDRVPDNSLIREEDIKLGIIDGSKSVFSSKDYSNTTLINLFKKYRDFCSSICQKDCMDKFYETYNMDSETSDDFIITIFPYKALPFYTYYNPKLFFSQFLIQFLSCFGIWLTVDFTSLIGVFTQIDRFFRLRIQKKI